MPTQQRPRRQQKRTPRRARQTARRGGQQGAIRHDELRPRDPPTQNLEFVAQHQQSDVFHVRAAAATSTRPEQRRQAIRAGEARSEWHVAESGINRFEGYQPYHLVGLAQTEPHIVVRVQLFGWNIWRVRFPRLASQSEPLGLRFDLTTRTVSLAAPRLSKPLAAPDVDDV